MTNVNCVPIGGNWVPKDSQYDEHVRFGRTLFDKAELITVIDLRHDSTRSSCRLVHRWHRQYDWLLLPHDSRLLPHAGLLLHHASMLLPRVCVPTVLHVLTIVATSEATTSLWSLLKT